MQREKECVTLDVYSARIFLTVLKNIEHLVMCRSVILIVNLPQHADSFLCC